MITLRPMRENDIRLNDGIEKMNRSDGELFERTISRGLGAHSYTIEKGGKVVASGGFVIIRPGVAEAWTLMSTLIHKYPVTVHKTALRVIDDFMSTYRIRRIQATCLKGFDRADKWLRALGFKYEGPMYQFGTGGETYLRFARTSNG